MTDQETRKDLEDRFHLIEDMVQQGRRTTQYWGWCFLLWGVAYLAATAWGSATGKPAIAWAVTMIAASVLTSLIAKMKASGKRTTIVGRSVMIFWITIGGALFLICYSTSLTGHAEVHSFAAAIETLIGTAHLASGWLLRWKTQIFNGLLWWGAAVASCLVQADRVGWIFIGMTLAGFVAFGVYLMVLESRAVSRGKLVVHA
jgi:hypothetical protein